MLRIIKISVLHFVLAVFFATVINVPAYSQVRIRFQNYTISNGLSQSSVNTMVQDDKGFVWIGTQDGLNKFDGYTFKVYKSKQNNTATLSNNFIHTICDDGEGNLWIGTDGGGLNIFNKATEKVRRVNLGPNCRFVYSLLKHGKYILVGTENGGVASLDIKTLKPVLRLSAKELGTNHVQSMFIQKDRYLWIGTGDNGLVVHDLNTKVDYTFKQGENFNNPLASDIIWSITQNKTGDVWVATNAGLYKIWGAFGSYKFDRLVNEPGNKASISSNSVQTVYITNTNNILVGTSGKGFTVIEPSPYGHYKYRHHMSSEYIPNSLVENNVSCFLEDKSGCIWVGTSNGVSRYDPAKQFFGHVTSVSSQPFSLNDKAVWSIAETHDGNYWVGTRAGLNLVMPNMEIIYHFPHTGVNRTAANDNSIFSLYPDKDGTVWVGAIDGFFKLKIGEGYKNVNFEPVPFKTDFDRYGDNRVYKIIEDESGLLWLATKQGLSIVNKRTGNFWFYNGRNNEKSKIKIGASRLIRTVFMDSKNIKWASSDDGFLYRIESAVVKEKLTIKSCTRYNLFKTLKGNDEILITSMWEDKKGHLWMGTFGAGIIEFNPASGKSFFYKEENGLSNNVVYGILGDDQGNLWMSTNRGLSMYDPIKKTFRNYEEKDGAQSNEFNTGAYFKNSKGEMMFGGINGYNVFNPADIKINQNKPLVAITDISLFNKPLVHGKDSPLKKVAPYETDIYLNYRQNNLSINYSALHYSNPENNQYKYMLDGADENYNFVGNVRSAHYTKLGYGDYKFKVYAANSDGVWSNSPAVINIHVSPPFWATWWFRTLAIILLCAMLYGIWQMRIYNMKAQRIKLAREVRERTKEVMLQNQKIEDQNKALELEKEKVENLLMNVLPKDTAEELKTRGKASARSYRQVTVMFTDFKGFTKQAEKMRPSDLVERLDSYFVEFDERIQKFGLEKIKTIGDAYMCAGGLPIRNKSNPIDTVLAALEIQDCMRKMNEQFSARGEDPWELRMGINTGEVIAGVIGIKRFAYDIWGSTVNVASRLETACEPGMMNVSGSTYAEIEPFFDCTYRGKIATKNTGEIDMYYVHRIKAGLSIDEDGIYPNDKFKKYVDLHLFSSINYKKAERHIMKVLKDKLPDNLYYHGIHHTYDVVEAIERIALLEGITGEEMFVLKSAATYHDAGFVKQYAKNEPIGIEMAKEILPLYGYTPEQVDDVEKLIYATIIPHDPKTHLQEIICDADLDYLGRDDFHQIADTLRMELSERGIVGSKRQWDEMQVKFLNMHKYFTKSAIRLRQAKKEKHIEEIKQRLLGKYDDEE
ncbi:MAG TPA: adenylate/guanylate cyclase domain-containing protein [Flavobacteriales bacterium]|nr:adenylate/guanylate cyclase domain-containing protein [Flavobacteriales bacterium]